MDLTWEHIKKINSRVCAQLEIVLGDDLPLTNVALIPRGGLVPASLVMYKLNLDKGQVYCANPPYPGARVLILDGIADTGETLKRERELAIKEMTARVYGWHGRILTATFVMRHSCQYPPDIYGLKYPGDDYINFPWEGTNDKEETGHAR